MRGLIGRRRRADPGDRPGAADDAPGAAPGRGDGGGPAPGSAPGPGPGEPDGPGAAEEATSAEIARVVGGLEGPAPLPEKARLMARLARLLAARLQDAGRLSLRTGRWMADLLLDVAPHLQVRDLATLQEHYGGLTGEALAEALTRNAVRASTAVGAAGGAAVAVQWAATPTLLAVPAEILAETLAVAVVEVKLVAELHEVYGAAPPGGTAQRATAYVQAWSHRRGVDPWRPATVPVALGLAGRRQLARRLLARTGRNLGTVVPFLVGAAVGARLNHQETRRLSDLVRADLRARGGPAPGRVVRARAVQDAPGGGPPVPRGAGWAPPA